MIQIHTNSGNTFTFFMPRKGEGLAEVKCGDAHALMEADLASRTLDQWLVEAEAEYRRDYPTMEPHFARENFVFSFEAPSVQCMEETIEWVDSLRPAYAHQLRCNFVSHSVAAYYVKYGGVLPEGQELVAGGMSYPSVKVPETEAEAEPEAPASADVPVVAY